MFTVGSKSCWIIDRRSFPTKIRPRSPLGTATMCNLEDAPLWRELRLDIQWRKFGQRLCDEDYSIYRTELRDVVNLWPMPNHRRAIRCADKHRGVYAFRDPSGGGEFLYVGKSDDGDKHRDIKVRVGQHLTPKDTGGDLRQNWCARWCQNEGCGCKSQCGGSERKSVGPEFRRFELQMLECEVWTITKPSADSGPMTNLEDCLIELTNPTYQTR